MTIYNNNKYNNNNETSWNHSKLYAQQHYILWKKNDWVIDHNDGEYKFRMISLNFKTKTEMLEQQPPLLTKSSSFRFCTRHFTRLMAFFTASHIKQYYAGFKGSYTLRLLALTFR